MPKRKRRSPTYTEKAMASLVDDLIQFDEFKEKILPALREDLNSGKTPEALREKYLALLTARQITIGLREIDSGKALAAIKDIQDRQEGKAVEKQEVVHRLEGLPDRELDALLQTKMAETRIKPTEKN